MAGISEADIAAAVLREHFLHTIEPLNIPFSEDSVGPWEAVCTCDIEPMPAPTYAEAEAAFAAHQAERVMAALTEAGQVEWGVMRGGGYISHHTREISRTIVDQHPRWTLVRRIVGPWEEQA